MLSTVRASGGRLQGLAENAEALTARAFELARRRVKESLLLEAMARQENLAVSDAEVDAEIEAMAAAYPAEGGARFEVELPVAESPTPPRPCPPSS